MNYKEYITEVPDFPKPGISFKDISPLLANNTIFTDSIWELGGLVDEKPDYWVGIDSRGFIFASALGNHFNCGIKLIRKAGKLPPTVFSYNYSTEYSEDTIQIKPGTGSVVIVDDVYATGGTMKAAENLCKSAGYDVIGKLVLIDLLYLHDKDETIKSLVQYE